jgi:esterase/lipase superfamily enzyme
MDSGQSKAPTRKEHVILIHGLAGSRLVMLPLAWRLKSAGYQTSTFGYPSWFWSIEHHARRFERCLQEVEADDTIERFHIVAHSMGTIVTRQALLLRDFKKLNRIVMLASPNRGSPVARALGTLLPFCKTLNQLSSSQNSFVCQLPEPKIVDTGKPEIGIIAAQHDRVVPAVNSRLGVEADHITLFSGHNGLLVRSTASKQVEEFLKFGRFSRVQS